MLGSCTVRSPRKSEAPRLQQREKLRGRVRILNAGKESGAGVIKYRGSPQSGIPGPHSPGRSGTPDPYSTHIGLSSTSRIVPEIAPK